MRAHIHFAVILMAEKFECIENRSHLDVILMLTNSNVFIVKMFQGNISAKKSNFLSKCTHKQQKQMRVDRHSLRRETQLYIMCFLSRYHRGVKRLTLRLRLGISDYRSYFKLAVCARSIINQTYFF